MQRRGVLLAAPLTAVLLAASWGWAKFGVFKTYATYLTHYPPAFHAPGKELRLDVNSLEPREGPAIASRLQNLLSQSLQGENFKLHSAAPTGLQCTVNKAAASVEEQTRAESINVHVGEHAETDKKGNTVMVEDCKFQTTDVTYLVSGGTLSVNVTATNLKTQEVLFTQLVRREYREESRIRGPRLCKGGRYGVSASQLRDSQTILGRLSEQAAAATVRFVAGYDEPTKVMLAVDNELKPGNAQASRGDWQQALGTWTGATIRNKETEAARQYNLGVAHEALAASGMRSGSFKEADSHLNEAEKCYQQAMRLDPKEKYFRDTLERLRQGRQVLKKGQDLAQAETSSQCADAREEIRRAQGLVESGQQGQARSLLLSALLDCPADPQNLDLLAEVHDSLGELAQAGTYREQAMRAAGISTQPTVSFTSAESSIERGKNATLSWKATYATEVEISPDLGRVPAKGTRSVAPAATTTYQLVARGPGGVTNASVQITVTLPRLTEENIVDLLKNEVPKARIARVASERGISFDLSPEVEKRLRTAGADDSLIEALKKARR